MQSKHLLQSTWSWLLYAIFHAHVKHTHAVFCVPLPPGPIRSGSLLWRSDNYVMVNGQNRSIVTTRIHTIHRMIFLHINSSHVVTTYMTSPICVLALTDLWQLILSFQTIKWEWCLSLSQCDHFYQPWVSKRSLTTQLRINHNNQYFAQFLKLVSLNDSDYALQWCCRRSISQQCVQGDNWVGSVKSI